MKHHFQFMTFAAAMLFVLSALGNLRAESGEGIRHIKFGDVDFYSIQDDVGEMDSGVLITNDKAALTRLSPTGKTPSSYAVFVVKKGNDVVLIDTGKGGKMIPRLQAIGIKPEDVKNVLLTHSHFDHVGGLVKDGQKVFPNATLWIDADELSFWKTARNKSYCEQCVKLYGEPKFLTPDEKTAAIFPELVSVPLRGHTPGQTGFLLSSGGVKLLVVADLLHNGAVQFARPDISIQYDNDPKQAAEVRRKTLQRAADEQLLIAASHLPFPSVGTVKVDGEGFRFESLSDSSTKMSLYNFTVKDIIGNDFPFEKLKGKKIMIVNVASKCGLTPQYEQLQALYTKYGADGKFVIVGFPANNFAAQEPGTNAEIAEFCSTRFRVTFPMMEKISVKGDDMHPLYKYLTEKKENGIVDAPVTWNFQKFLFDEKGNLVAVVPPKVKPDAKPIIDWLEGRSVDWNELKAEK
ncbi:MAG TPA: hypothetical protein DEB39_06430 [Planctomycetaceae bacterium]|nr:hypothetical protein [Planctomycetaceae bacterium]